MAGHGSPPPEDRANHPGRQVGAGHGIDTAYDEGEWPGLINQVTGRKMKQDWDYDDWDED